MLENNGIVISTDDMVNYIKLRLDDEITVDRDTIEKILDLGVCFLDDKGLIDY